MIQIRHVPERLHRRLKACAAAAGMNLSDFIRLELERTAAQLSAAEVVERLAQLPPVQLDESAAAAVRAERDAR